MDHDLQDGTKTDEFSEKSDNNSGDESNEYAVDLDHGEVDEFFFESDHLALRGNPDYQSLLKAYVLISAQKNELLKNYDILNSALELSQEKPMEFVEEFRIGKLKLPERIKPFNIPKIDITKYENKVPDTVLAKAKTIFMTIQSNDNFSKATDTGRLSDIGSTDRSNKLWTVAEQRRLEELLVQYPPEEIEMRRFAKIAKALGNRTTKQVASRLQKYFLKLHKAGLPVPGRLPRTRAGKGRSKHSVFNGSYSLMRPSTFFPTLNIPSGLHNLKNQDMKNIIPHISSENSSDVSNYMDDEVTESESNSDESGAEEDCLTVDQSIFRLFKRVFKDKQKDNSRPNSIHIGYSCEFCKETPINGTRWHCMDCKNYSVDFCSDCLIAQTENPDGIAHPLSHNMVPFRCKAQSNTDEQKQTVGIDEPSKSDNLIKDEIIDHSEIDHENYVRFKNSSEADFISYLTSRFQNKIISSGTFLSEMLSLNLANCDLRIDMGKGAVISNPTSEFLRDKTVLKAINGANGLCEQMFANYGDAVNAKLLTEKDKLELSEYLSSKDCIVKKELLDHDYSYSGDLPDLSIKEEIFDYEYDAHSVDQEGSTDQACETSNFHMLGDYLFDIGREEFV